jgi:hypothetical protein
VVVGIMIGTFCYEKIALREQNRDINLFSLVPEESEAVLEIKDVHSFFSKLEGTAYYPHFMDAESSQLIRLLHRNIGLLSSQQTHGLSGRANRLLMSFHAPGTGRDQVVYGSLSPDDHHSLRLAFEQSGVMKDYAKEADYRGEKIWIVPLNNEEFISCYVRKNFFAISYEKHLLERVVDAYLDENKSVLKDPLFKQLTRSHSKSQHSTYLYMRARPFCAWADFNLRLHDRVIYMIGEGHAGDGMNPKKISMLDEEEAMKKGIDGTQHGNSNSVLADSVWAYTLYRGTKVHLDGARLLPEKTVLYGLCAIDHPEVLPISFGQTEGNGRYTLYDYLREFSLGEVQWTRFEDEDSDELLCVAAIPMRADGTLSDARWYSLCSAPADLKAVNGVNYVRYTLTVDGEPMLATCWNHQLLLSTSGWKALERYIRAVEHGEEREEIFGEEDADMFQDFNLTAYAHLDALLDYPRLFKGPLTRSLFQNEDLFRHFNTSVQLLSSDDHYYINLLFTYSD